jgi:hypothetical protein
MMTDERTVVEIPDNSKARIRIFKAEIARAHLDNEHLWVATLTFRVTPPLRDGTMLPVEDLRMGPVAFCWLCDITYLPGVDPACPGLPPAYSLRED